MPAFEFMVLVPAFELVALGDDAAIHVNYINPGMHLDYNSRFIFA